VYGFAENLAAVAIDIRECPESVVLQLELVIRVIEGVSSRIGAAGLKTELAPIG
jgi:hypothetical protein